MSASEPPCCVPSEVSPWPPGPLSDRSTSVSAWVGAAVWSSAPLPLWARAAGEIIASAASRDIRFTRIHLSFPGSDTCSPPIPSVTRSEAHTSELQSLMRTSYAFICLKKKKQTKETTTTHKYTTHHHNND